MFRIYQQINISIWFHSEILHSNIWIFCCSFLIIHRDEAFFSQDKLLNVRKKLRWGYFPSCKLFPLWDTKIWFLSSEVLLWISKKIFEIRFCHRIPSWRDFCWCQIHHWRHQYGGRRWVSLGLIIISSYISVYYKIFVVFPSMEQFWKISEIF